MFLERYPVPVMIQPLARRRLFAASAALTGLLVAVGLPAHADTASAPTATSINKTSGGSSATRTVTMTGTGFSQLAGIKVGGVACSTSADYSACNSFTVVSDTTVKFVLAPDSYQPGTDAIVLTPETGSPIPTTLTFKRWLRTKVDREMAYAFVHWNDGAKSTAAKRFGYFIDNDCANFTSQSLLARGWSPSDAWYNAGPINAKSVTGGVDSSSTWISSTALSSWLKTRPDLATRLGYSGIDQVSVGDVVQFNWDGVGSTWDHTAIVSRVVVLPNGHHDVYYVAHTSNRQYGGSVRGLREWMSYTVPVKDANGKVVKKNGKTVTKTVYPSFQFFHLR